jgi:hypothetical protein
MLLLCNMFSTIRNFLDGGLLKRAAPLTELLVALALLSAGALSPLLIPQNLAAQTVCLAPARAAGEIVQYYLSEPDSALQSILDRYHIRAKRASDLMPLTDRDSVRCRQLDSLVRPHPVYYWRAGSAILSSNYSDSAMSIVRNEWYPFVRLFDDQGVPLYPPRRSIPIHKDPP